MSSFIVMVLFIYIAILVIMVYKNGNYIVDLEERVKSLEKKIKGNKIDEK